MHKTIQHCLKKLSLLFAVIAVILLSSCNAEELYSHDYLCRFALDISLHPATQVETAVKSPGTFVWVTFSKIDEIGHYYVHTYGNNTVEEITMTTDRENFMAYELGAYNGIFIGCTNFDGPAAFDRQCPNCIALTGLPKYPLTWVEKRPMQVTCASCKRVYSLENGASETDGKPLMRYAAAINGTQITASN